MEADGFSKPHEPATHKPFVVKLLGEDKINVTTGARCKIQRREKILSQFVNQASNERGINKDLFYLVYFERGKERE
jgi:hypothetical protein